MSSVNNLIARNIFKHFMQTNVEVNCSSSPVNVLAIKRYPVTKLHLIGISQDTRVTNDLFFGDDEDEMVRS